MDFYGFQSNLYSEVQTTYGRGMVVVESLDKGNPSSFIAVRYTRFTVTTMVPNVIWVSWELRHDWLTDLFHQLPAGDIDPSRLVAQNDAQFCLTRTVQNKCGLEMRVSRKLYVDWHYLEGERKLSARIAHKQLRTHGFGDIAGHPPIKDVGVIPEFSVTVKKTRWLYITLKWAVRAPFGTFHVGNVTDNRPENANGRLKDLAHHSDTMEHAIPK
ncbi:hypothetical protein CLF_100443, partial [Clonorchis sinensis]